MSKNNLGYPRLGKLWDTLEARFMADAIYILIMELFSNVYKVDIKLSEHLSLLLFGMGLTSLDVLLPPLLLQMI